MRPELLTKVSEHRAGPFIVDHRYGLQEKRDGERLLVKRRGPSLQAWNKSGIKGRIPKWLASALLSLNVNSFTIDGEVENSQFACWDLLEAEESDLRSYPYEQRHSILKVFRACPAVHVLPLWEGEAEKTAKLFELLADGAEGVVFKNKNASYQSGRAGQHFAIKFVKSATVQVGKVDPHRDRVSILMLDRGVWREVGGMKVPNGKLRGGEFVEVKYLTASANRRLVQPRFKMIRTDVGPGDCSIDQLQFSGRFASIARSPR